MTKRARAVVFRVISVLQKLNATTSISYDHHFLIVVIKIHVTTIGREVKLEGDGEGIKFSLSLSYYEWFMVIKPGTERQYLRIQ